MKRLRVLARAIGFAIFAAYVTIGAFVLFMMMIGGFWEGFSRQSYVLMFMGMCMYVYGTAWIAYSFGRRPGRVRGVILAMLLIPAVVFMFRDSSGQAELNEAARIYIENSDPQAVDVAREQLLAQGRRTGEPRHLALLLEALHEATDDEQRRRMVLMLGALSYQNETVLESLRALRDETASDPQRQALHTAVIEAIRGVNP